LTDEGKDVVALWTRFVSDSVFRFLVSTTPLTLSLADLFRFDRSIDPSRLDGRLFH